MSTAVKKHYEVVAAAIMHGGKVLCMQRGQTRFAYTSHKWEFPGGKIEPGETPEEALRREIREEMDLEIAVGRLITTVSHEYPDFSITMRTYECRPVSPHRANTEHESTESQPSTPEFTLLEHESSRWLPYSELPTLDWAAADRKVVAAMMAAL